MSNYPLAPQWSKSCYLTRNLPDFSVAQSLRGNRVHFNAVKPEHCTPVYYMNVRISLVHCGSIFMPLQSDRRRASARIILHERTQIKPIELKKIRQSGSFHRYCFTFQHHPQFWAINLIWAAAQEGKSPARFSLVQPPARPNPPQSTIFLFSFSFSF